MHEPVVDAEIVVPPSLPVSVSSQQRIFALCVLLTVSFAHFVSSSFYYLLVGVAPVDLNHNQYRIVGALITQISSLFLLWYVVAIQKRSWKEIGWAPSWSEIPRGFGLMLVTIAVAACAAMLFQLVFHAVAGHYLSPRSFRGAFGFGISALSVIFILINPFFEELIVRGYLMSEVIDLGGGRTWAIVISVAVQMSYHLYQGVLNCVALVATFVVLSIYFSRTRRIVPVIFVHLCFDSYALIRGAF